MSRCNGSWHDYFDLLDFCGRLFNNLYFSEAWKNFFREPIYGFRVWAMVEDSMFHLQGLGFRV